MLVFFVAFFLSYVIVSLAIGNFVPLAMSFLILLPALLLWSLWTLIVICYQGDGRGW